MPTPHNNALNGQIAETVLMPGDPLRAKFIAENFLTGAECVNTVRNALGFTGTYKGEKIARLLIGHRATQPLFKSSYFKKNAGNDVFIFFRPKYL